MNPIEKLLSSHGFWIKNVSASKDGYSSYELWFRDETGVGLGGYTNQNVDGVCDKLEFICHHKRKGFPKYEYIREFMGNELVGKIKELDPNYD